MEISNEKIRIAVCPLCQCKYQIPDAFMDRTVLCKKCGSNFGLDSKVDDKQINDCQITSFFKEKVEEINQYDSYLVIGKLALKNKFVSEEQLKKALSIQEQRKRDGQNLFLGEIMVLLGIMSQSQLDFLLLVQKML